MLRRASEADPVSGDLLSYVSNNQVQWVAAPATIDGIEDLTNKDHDLLDGLGDDDHTQYALLAGRAGGQTLIGGPDASNDLTIKGTSHGTPSASRTFIGVAPTITVNEDSDFFEFTEGTQDKCKVDLSAAAFTHNSTGNWLAINWDAEDFDPNGMHSTSVNTSRITFNTAGYYLIGGNVRFAANATGQRGIRITDGTTVLGLGVRVDAAASGATQLNVATLHQMAAASYAELEVYQDSGGNLAITLTEGADFWAVKVA
jgi:hypothetical protein